MENHITHNGSVTEEDFIFVTEGKKEMKLYFDEISHCKANGKGTLFYKVWLDKTKPQESYYMRKNIGFYFCKLTRAGFLRHHDSYMSNTKHFVNVDTENKYIIEITGGIFLPTSAGRKCVVIDYLNSRKG